MLRVKCVPKVNYLFNFLVAKGFLMVDENPNILHYSGTNLKELKALVKKDRPDLLITHSISVFKTLDIPQVYHPLHQKIDLERISKIYTNKLSLCRHYYERLGLQEEIKIVPSLKKKESKWEVNFLKCSGYSFRNLLDSYWKTFKRFMNWN